MTLKVTVPDSMYRQIAEMAAQQQVSMERIVAGLVVERASGVIPASSVSRTRKRE